MGAAKPKLRYSLWPIRNQTGNVENQSESKQMHVADVKRGKACESESRHDWFWFYL